MPAASAAISTYPLSLGVRDTSDKLFNLSKLSFFCTVSLVDILRKTASSPASVSRDSPVAPWVYRGPLVDGKGSSDRANRVDPRHNQDRPIVAPLFFLHPGYIFIFIRVDFFLFCFLFFLFCFRSLSGLSIFFFFSLSSNRNRATPYLWSTSLLHQRGLVNRRYNKWTKMRK